MRKPSENSFNIYIYIYIDGFVFKIHIYQYKLFSTIKHLAYNSTIEKSYICVCMYI